VCPDTPHNQKSAVTLGSVASNGKAAPLIWFPVGYRLTGNNYVKALEGNLLQRLGTNYLDGNVVFQQDGTPAHTTNKATEVVGSIPFSDKNMWPPHSSDASPLNYTFLSKACTVCHPNIYALKATINQHWDNMLEDYCISKKGARNFAATWSPSLMPRVATSIIRTDKAINR